MGGCVRYYLSRHDDTVDSIAWAVYGRQDGRLVERLLDGNPRLADFGAVLPPGVVVVVPDAPEPAQSEGLRLWD